MDAHMIRRVVEEQLEPEVRRLVEDAKRKAKDMPKFDPKDATQEDGEYAVAYWREDHSLTYERALHRAMCDSWVLRGRKPLAEVPVEQNDRMAETEIPAVLQFMRETGEKDVDACLRYVRAGVRPAKKAQPGKPRRTEAQATPAAVRGGPMTEAEIEPTLRYMREGKSQEDALRMVRSGRR